MSSNTQKLNDVAKFMKNEVYSELTMTHFQLFMEVATNEGITMSEIKERLGMLGGTLSRNMRTLGQYYGKVKGKQALRGLNLLRYEPDMHDRRALSCHLTDRGREVYQQIVKMVKNEHGTFSITDTIRKKLAALKRPLAQGKELILSKTGSCSGCQNTVCQRAGCCGAST